MNTVENINALEGLKNLDDNSIDLIVTDPPYKVISGGKGDHNSPKGMLKSNDGKIFKHNDIKITEWIDDCYRVLKDDTHIYVMVNMLNLSEYMIEIEKAGFKIHNLLVWQKNNVTPNRWYMKNCEYIIFAYKGKAKMINNVGCSNTVHICKNITGNKNHPTEKPIELMKFYIENSSKKGDLVLDPFMGSGSVAIASKLSNRNFIGFEIDENYYNVIQKRLNELRTQNLF